MREGQLNRQDHYRKAAARLRSDKRIAFMTIIPVILYFSLFLTVINSANPQSIKIWINYTAWIGVVVYYVLMLFLLKMLIELLLQRGIFARPEHGWSNAMYRFHCNQVFWAGAAVFGAVTIMLGAMIFAIIIIGFDIYFIFPKWLIIFPLPMILIMTLIGFKAIRLPKKNHSVLWLRKFGHLDRKSFPLNKLLQSAYGGWWAITLRDKSVKISWTRARVKAAPYIVYAAILASILFFLGFISGIFRILSQVLDPMVGGVIVSSVISAVAFTPWFLKLMEYRSEAVPDPETGGAQICSLIHKQAGARQPPVGITVLATTTENWRDAVTAAISNVDAVLLDLTRMTENIEWEIKQCFSIRPPEQIIIAFQSAEPGSEVFEGELKAHVCGLVGEDNVERARKFGYPESRGKRVEIDLLASNMILTELVAACIDSNDMNRAQTAGA